MDFSKFLGVVTRFNNITLDSVSANYSHCVLPAVTYMQLSTILLTHAHPLLARRTYIPCGQSSEDLQSHVHPGSSPAAIESYTITLGTWGLWTLLFNTYSTITIGYMYVQGVVQGSFTGGKGNICPSCPPQEASSTIPCSPDMLYMPLPPLTPIYSFEIFLYVNKTLAHPGQQSITIKAPACILAPFPDTPPGFRCLKPSKPSGKVWELMDGQPPDLVEPEGGFGVETDDVGEVLVVSQQSDRETEEHSPHFLVLGAKSATSLTPCTQMPAKTETMK